MFLSTDRAMAIYKECETARRNAVDMEAALKAQPPAPSYGFPWLPIAIAGSAGVALGLVFGAVALR